MPEREDPRPEPAEADDGPLLRDPPPPPGWVDPFEESESLDELQPADTE